MDHRRGARADGARLQQADRMPNDLPPWAAVYQQTQRWLAAGCLEALVDDLCAVLRLAAGRKAEPTAAIIDSRTLRSTPESGERAGYDGGKALLSISKGARRAPRSKWRSTRWVTCSRSM